MAKPADKLLKRFYGSSKHPYKSFEETVGRHLRADSVLLDAGCGRTVPVLRGFAGRAGRLIGVEVIDFTDVPAGIDAIKSDLAHVPLPDHSVDVIMSRSVFEHLTDPVAVYREMHRLLKPGGRLVFLTANAWDYATVLARLIPNRFHGSIVNVVEGRAEEDVFPTAYKTNSRRQVDQLAKDSGLEVQDFEYLGQYPNYFMFSRILFVLGTAYDKLICRFDSLRFLRGWILVTLKKPG